MGVEPEVHPSALVTERATTMRPRLGIALGGAALAGVAGASLASWQAGPPTAVRLIVPAGAVGGNVLGSPNPAAPAPGLSAGWLMLRTLPDRIAPAPSAPTAPAVVALSPAPAAPPASARTSAPLPVILASFPVHLPSLLHVLPVPVSLPPISLPHPVGNPGSHTPAPGHPGSGGHGHNHGGQGHSGQAGLQSLTAQYLRSSVQG
jgi:hypothetical protein